VGCACISNGVQTIYDYMFETEESGYIEIHEDMSITLGWMLMELRWLSSEL
jgi:hypothetical protein